MWDLVWLHQQGAEPDIELISAKLADYQLQTTFSELLQSRIDSIEPIIATGKFQTEMKRFIPLRFITELLANLILWFISVIP